ncbi:uncharacterized protein LOC112088339 [Eutrema salsugineum]|uniref:uncharacterized protein LOC112088339 n=1 Tax=Eutrema salsugineum TaxID=72664 RepID=UPI000CED7478|nr:uncharacterized protein LOC112088339 [Eutrema salsugineum]
MVTRPLSEGGLGLGPLKETNKISSLKLIWRILSARDSLWVTWTHQNLIGKNFFWSIKEKTQAGSWIWRKLLKLRPVAKLFHRMDIRSGSATSFWFDHWSGRLVDIMGQRGCIDLGIRENTTVEMVLKHHRRRRHRVGILNQVEDEIEKYRASANYDLKDVALWKCGHEKFKQRFRSKDTWLQIRQTNIRWGWEEVVWFKYATPKYSFFHWTVMHNSISTGDRMIKWNANANPSCVLCNHPLKTVDHLFFNCPFSDQIWQTLIRGLLRDRYTTNWHEVLSPVKDSSQDRISLFILQYTLQATIYGIWRERNDNGMEETPPTRLDLSSSLTRRFATG